MTFDGVASSSILVTFVGMGVASDIVSEVEAHVLCSGLKGNVWEKKKKF